MSIEYFTEDLNSWKPFESKALWNQIATDASEFPADQVVRDLCERFREGDKASRASLRTKYAGNRNLLIFVHRMANQIMRDQQVKVCLTDGVTAMLLENCRFNYRDSLSYCGMLRFATDHVDLDFKRNAIPLVENGIDFSTADEIVRYFAGLERGKVSLAKFSLRTLEIGDFRQLAFS